MKLVVPSLIVSTCIEGTHQLWEHVAEFAVAVPVYKKIMLCMLQAKIDCDVAI